MTPARGKVKQVFRYLENGDEPSLTLEEKGQIQEWLDNSSSGQPGGIPHSAEIGGATDALELVVAHYCRHKHNDWSEDWIRNNLNRLEWHDYVGWLDDLVQLCRSHHFGYSELREAAFDPKLAGGGSAPSVVHRRYLACVLRISDILEFDPERTPDIVFTHRSIAASSEIYWQKDHHIQLMITGEPKHIFLNAEPPNARVHRAVIDMAEQIDAELTLCRRLAHETHFEKFGPMPDLKHRWDLPYVVDRRIEPKAGSYVYIDGAFRPNTQKILELLSGQELYGSPLAAVRELLQNAFDATRELVAREILASNMTTTSKSVASDRYTVELRLEKEDGRAFLTCSDEGVGMSKHIIENYFLVSGSAKRHDILDLERRCQKLGLRLGRTGQFGIGVLSYFMIADQVTISTRRHNICGDSEPNAWTFETEGVGTFGELRKAPANLIGTSVRLRLRDDVTRAGLEDFWDGVRSYIRGTVVRMPCVLRLRADAFSVQESHVPGWLMDSTALATLALSGLGHSERYGKGPPLEALSSARRKEIERQSAYWRQVREDATSAIRWHSLTGDLPSNAGAYRVSIPYFGLVGGDAFAFLRAKEHGQQLVLEPIAQGLAYIPRGHEISAWRGMRADERTYVGRRWSQGEALGVREIDWEASETGSVSINRDSIRFSPEASLAATWLRDRITAEYRALAGESRHGAFAALNYRILGDPPPEGTRHRWRGAWQPEHSEPVRWEDVLFPATASLAFKYFRIPQELSNLGTPVAVIPSLGSPDDDDHYDGLSWNSDAFQPDRILVYDYLGTKLVPVWDQAPSSSRLGGSLLRSRFPDEWNELSGTQISDYSSEGDAIVWNLNNAFAMLLDDEDQRWVAENVGEEADPLAIGDRIVSTRGRCASWLSFLIAKGSNSDLWRGIFERDPSFLKAVWDLVFGSGDQALKIKLWTGKGLRVMSVNGWTFQEEVGSWEKNKGDARALNGDLLPAAGPRWILLSKKPDRLLLTARRLAKPRSSGSPPSTQGTT